jgi:hypothetical protein
MKIGRRIIGLEGTDFSFLGGGCGEAVLSTTGKMKEKY